MIRRSCYPIVVPNRQLSAAFNTHQLPIFLYLLDTLSQHHPGTGNGAISEYDLTQAETDANLGDDIVINRIVMVGILLLKD